ncbi:MAG TPA: hypothetical protein VMY38_08670, partial [Gemmatimonadaceae bacterium]|nr:hypothetical protein [Gemmatimonadaceae bacterium]
QGSRIAAVGPTRSIPIPKDARIVDGRGMFLIPGLINTHVHVARLADTPQFEGALALEMLDRTALDSLKAVIPAK